MSGHVRVLPGRRFYWSVLSLEALTDDRAGQHAIRINEIVRERRAVTADTALRLSQFFGSTPEFWINLQSFHDLRKAINENGALIRREVGQLKRSA